MKNIQKHPSLHKLADQRSTFLNRRVGPRVRVLTAEGAAQRLPLSTFAAPPREMGVITPECDSWITLGGAAQRVLATLERERADRGSSL